MVGWRLLQPRMLLSCVVFHSAIAWGAAVCRHAQRSLSFSKRLASPSCASQADLARRGFAVQNVMSALGQ